MQWQLRSKVEPWVVTCPGCGKKKGTQGRNNTGKKVAGDSLFVNKELNMPKRKKEDPVKQQERINKERAERRRKKKRLQQKDKKKKE